MKPQGKAIALIIFIVAFAGLADYDVTNPKDFLAGFIAGIAGLILGLIVVWLLEV